MKSLCKNCHQELYTTSLLCQFCGIEDPTYHHFIQRLGTISLILKSIFGLLTFIISIAIWISDTFISSLVAFGVGIAIIFIINGIISVLAKIKVNKSINLALDDETISNLKAELKSLSDN